MTEKMTQPRTIRRLRIAISQDRHEPDIWRVDAIDYDAGGVAEVTVFSGENAKDRAYVFAAWSYPESFRRELH